METKRICRGSLPVLYEGISVFCWLWAYGQRMNKNLLTLNTSLPGETTNSFCWALQWDDKSTLQLVMLVLMRYFHPCKQHTKTLVMFVSLFPKDPSGGGALKVILTFLPSSSLTIWPTSCHLLLMLVVSCLTGGLGCFTMGRWNSRDFQRIAKNGLN